MEWWGETEFLEIENLGKFLEWRNRMKLDRKNKHEFLILD